MGLVSDATRSPRSRRAAGVGHVAGERVDLRRLDPPVRDRCEPYDVLSVMAHAPAHARGDEVLRQGRDFAVVAGAAVTLILVGTVAYSLGEGWNVIDGFYFAVCTLTTSSIADPNLTLTHEALKLFTALYVLTGIGILVELARQIGVGFVKERKPPDTPGATRKIRPRHSRRDSSKPGCGCKAEHQT